MHVKQTPQWDSSAFLPTICSITNTSVPQDCIEKRGEFVGSACGPKGPYVPDVLFWCVILFFSTVIMSAFLKDFKFSNYFPTKVRAVSFTRWVKYAQGHCARDAPYRQCVKVQWCTLAFKHSYCMTSKERKGFTRHTRCQRRSSAHLIIDAVRSTGICSLIFCNNKNV